MIRGNLFDRSVTISEKLHQVGGFTDALKHNQSMMNAICPANKIVSAAALKPFAILLYATLRSYFDMSILSLG